MPTHPSPHHASSAPLAYAAAHRAARLVAILATLLTLTGCTFPGFDDDLRQAMNQFPSQRAGDLNYFAAGDTKTQRVIYVHGTPGDASGWANYLQNPIPETESIAIDRLGFGRSLPDGKQQAVVSFNDQADAIKPLLVKRDGRWPILVGHSLGGPIVAKLAANAPDRVGGIVILAGSLDPGLEEIKWFNRAAATPVLRLIIPKPLRISNTEIFAAREQTQSLAKVLDQVRCPVVIVHGTEDHLVPYANVAYMQQTLTNAERVQVIKLENEGHFLPWRREAEVRAAIESLLNAP